MKVSVAAVVGSFLLLSAHTTWSKAVFCHYMISTIDPTTDHAALDVSQAQSIGFDAFALNIGDPTASFTDATISQLFTQAAQKDFKLFFSLDLSASPDLTSFSPYLQKYLGHEAYYRAGGSGNLPFLSTFDGGTKSPAEVSEFLGGLGEKLHFVPGFDDAPGYYDDADAFFGAWKGVVDGVFSWETAWPGQSDSPQNFSTSSDERVQSAAISAGKDYMMGFSSLQYKDLSPDHWYRAGESLLPQRMSDILAMKTPPDLVELISWNDAGESHYIGNIWSEGLPADILVYANQSSYPHHGWQPLISSFIAAYKAGKPCNEMAPPSGTAAVGAIWYRPFLTQSASCNKPAGAGAAIDAVNYAVVLSNEKKKGYKIRVVSDGVELSTVAARAGLNYGTIHAMRTGQQKLELLDEGGDVVMAAESVLNVQSDMSGDCNYNYQVAGLASKSVEGY